MSRAESNWRLSRGVRWNYFDSAADRMVTNDVAPLVHSVLVFCSCGRPSRVEQMCTTGRLPGFMRVATRRFAGEEAVNVITCPRAWKVDQPSVMLNF